MTPLVNPSTSWILEFRASYVVDVFWLGGLAQAGVREFQVVQGGRVIGVVGDGDIIRAIAERGGVH